MLRKRVPRIGQRDEPRLPARWKKEKTWQSLPVNRSKRTVNKLALAYYLYQDCSKLFDSISSMIK